VFSAGPPAHADTVSGTRSDAVVEQRHVISLVMARDHATLRVERRLYNGGTRHDQALIGIDLPEGAVATGVRTLGEVRGRPVWFEGELLEAEAAARRYEALTGIGGYYPKDPALLSYRYPSFLMLQVFPLAPQAPKSVGYTLELPTQYRSGRFHVALPRLGTATLDARLSALPKDATDRLLANGKAIRRGSALSLEREVELELIPATMPPFGGELATIAFAPKRVLTHVALRAAPKLSEVPKGAYVVVLVDGSRSTSLGFVNAAKTALAAYLSHFADARVSVLVFDRRVHRDLGSFVPVADARARLANLTIVPQNGSHVDLALFEASELLATAPKLAPKRVLLVTDGYARSSLTPERLRGALGNSDLLAHVALLDAGATALERADGHVWANAIRTSGGLVWRASAPERVDSDGHRIQAARVFEEWARPLRIDGLEVFSSDDSSNSAIAAELPASLAEGEGAEKLFIAEHAASELRFQGELWAKPLAFSARSTPERERLWAGLVFGSALLGELSEAEMMPLALLGGAVSPVTSYLAIEPGVRPSTEGLEPSERVHRVRRPMVRLGGTLHTTGRGIELDREAFLRERLAPEWVRCGGTPGGVSVMLETTFAEIVSVDVDAHLATDDPILESCMAEAVWALTLPAGFFEEWAPYVFDV
jgi:hypothetical protein